MIGASTKVVAGCKLPSTAPPSDTELAWIEFLRLICDDDVPGPTLPLMQGLRLLIAEHRVDRRSG